MKLVQRTYHKPMQQDLRNVLRAARRVYCPHSKLQYELRQQHQGQQVNVRWIVEGRSRKHLDVRQKLLGSRGF